MMMKIEKFTNYLCTIESDDSLTTVAIPWDNCEYIPAITGEAAKEYNFPFRVKIIKHPKWWNISRSLVVIRTDVYPLLWVYVWLRLQAENQIDKVFSIVMWHCNRLEIAKTEPGSVPSIKDFKIDKFLVIQLIANAVFTSIFVSLLKAEQPVLCFFCFLLNWFLQYLVSKQRDKKRALIKHFREIEIAAINSLRAENIFVRDCVGNLIPAFPPTVSAIDCQGCKYFYGKQNIVCAVHPEGYEGNYCGDRCNG